MVTVRRRWRALPSDLAQACLGSPYCASQIWGIFFLFFFLKIEGKDLHQQKYYAVLDHEAHFIAGVWN